MDVNSNRSNNQASSKPRRISRLKKEMLEHRMQHNPFSSPPSSTGSHDTVSTTEELTRNLSNFSFDPDGEGTRRIEPELPSLSSKRQATRSGRFGQRQTQQNTNTVLNTSAIAKTFPEWSGLLSNNKDATVSQTFDFAGILKPPAMAGGGGGGKENVPPAVEGTEEQTTFDNPLDSKRKRVRADMQPRVENESECSTVLSLSLSPARVMASRRSRFANLDGVVASEPAKNSLKDMVSKIRNDQQANKREAASRQFSQSQALTQPNYEAQSIFDKTGVSPTGRSFLMPAFRHLPDWTSGTLQFSAMKNGVPVFVRHGKARFEQSPQSHGAIQSVGITEEDEEIFVSMDKLQEEVRELHDHDAMLQREAEKLQREVNQLQSELKRFRNRHPSDSAIGSDTDASFRRSGGHDDELEGQIAELRGRLENASRQVGVQDIHSAALTAERDEALRQASVARERAAKLQAVLEGNQKDLELSTQIRQDKEMLQLENDSLIAENETLRHQHDQAIKQNKVLVAENDKLRRELAGVQKDLRATREELASARKQCESLREENRMFTQDHKSMERNNDTYFSENKRLQAQVAARDQHILELKKGINNRDKIIDNMQSLTTDTAVLELNADLEAEIERLANKLDQLSADAQDRDGDIKARDGRIRSLKEQNLDLSMDNDRMRTENQRLRSEHEDIQAQWTEERHKVARLNQFLSRNNGDHHKALNNNTEDCIRLEDDFKQKELDLQHKLDRREAAVRKVKLLTKKITEIAEQEFTALALQAKTAPRVKVVDPKDLDDFTGRSSNINVDEDPTTELHMTQESDFASVMEGELAKLKQTYRELQRRQRESTEQLTDYSLPGLQSAPSLQRSRSDGSAQPSKMTQTRGQGQLPPGILKKSSQFAQEEDTGRFSLRSAAMSFVSDDDDEDVQHTSHSRKSSTNYQDEFTRPESRLRRNSETTRENPTGTTEPNMTSAFFMPDITMSGARPMSASNTTTTNNNKQAVPSLSKDARRVLDGICSHKSGNCHVCVRIAAHGDKQSTTIPPSSVKIQITAKDLAKGKKTVSVEKPVPVSDRRASPASKTYSDEPTLRPSMPPGEALAILIKETKDEIEHLQMELKELNEVYFGLDKSVGARERKRVMGEIKRVQGEVEAKSAQLYRLHDVLEGQKVAGQVMERDEVDVTVLGGLVRTEVGTGVEAGGRSKNKEREREMTGSEWEDFE
ncbi:hypothetical protein QBC42DRAFT_328276 [Cladorrhinum samala]|uniref:Uncharacterized protein n=1 Tax=Cladorrhinum samala TaxID=585594 RepID=A0AAV9HP06_9PEZI|nr:hypothetical protein QBC42DRAFT_328276 [Cladorrhinum samala]